MEAQTSWKTCGIKWIKAKEKQLLFMKIEIIIVLYAFLSSIGIAVVTTFDLFICHVSKLKSCHNAKCVCKLSTRYVFLTRKHSFIANNKEWKKAIYKYMTSHFQCQRHFKIDVILEKKFMKGNFFATPGWANLMTNGLWFPFCHLRTLILGGAKKNQQRDLIVHSQTSNGKIVSWNRMEVVKRCNLLWWRIFYHS